MLMVITNIHMCHFEKFSLNFQEVERYKLGNPKSFHFLNQSDCYELDGVNDGHEYLATRRAMDVVGISEQEQVRLFLWFKDIICFGGDRVKFLVV